MYARNIGRKNFRGGTAGAKERAGYGEFLIKFTSQRRTLNRNSGVFSNNFTPYSDFINVSNWQTAACVHRSFNNSLQEGVCACGFPTPAKESLPITKPEKSGVDWRRWNDRFMVILYELVVEATSEVHGVETGEEKF